MIKRIAAGSPPPTGGRSHSDVQRYWVESHGPLIAQNRRYRRYVQHMTLPEAFIGEPAATFTGVSEFWHDDLDSVRLPPTSEELPQRQATSADDRQLFDRVPDWPRHHKRAAVVGEERVIVDGETAPSMVKAIFMVSRLSGLDYEEFFEHWHDVHGGLGAKVPGVRRYVQNHLVVESLTFRSTTHDGWSELWFDDFAAFRRATASPEWSALHEDGLTLFQYPMGVVVGREVVQKDEHWQPNDFGALSMSEDEIRERLRREGYTSLATDPSVPSKIKAAASKGLLAVWTPDHVVTLDESRIDARPAR